MPLHAAVLIPTAFLTSVVSGTVGMGGGIVLLAVMAQYFPPAVLIPLHGLIQLASNSSRVLYGFRRIERRIMARYALGAALGAALGSRVVASLPESWYKLALGAFLLALTVRPAPRRTRDFPFKWAAVGAVATFLSLIAGATGPLIAPFFLSEPLDRRELVATKASCQIFTHLLKVGVFVALGFAFGPYLPLLAAMTAAVFAGNYLGNKVLLHRLPERAFRAAFKGLLLVLSLRMIWLGARAF
ncbi:MAG: sulfite exporter TauE/SafE family protein [Elusimicrobia bacterium]|nr:sulfite exporter TauE/SafE family protein [Elusimicrobiota bacterium]